MEAEWFNTSNLLAATLITAMMSDSAVSSAVAVSVVGAGIGGVCSLSE
jgi:hypothetical protein